jgi:hypothetical protein
VATKTKRGREDAERARLEKQLKLLEQVNGDLQRTLDRLETALGIPVPDRYRPPRERAKRRGMRVVKDESDALGARLSFRTAASAAWSGGSSTRMLRAVR